MSEFFQHYPQISYNISGTKPAKLKTVINLMEKVKLKGLVADDIVAYFPYSIMEGERPDHVSKKVYGNVKYTWLIFLINDMSDPIYDWPLGTREFGAFIKILDRLFLYTLHLFPETKGPLIYLLDIEYYQKIMVHLV